MRLHFPLQLDVFMANSHPSLSRSLVGGPVAGTLLVRDNGSYITMIICSGCTTMIGSFFILASKITIDKRVLARV